MTALLDQCAAGVLGELVPLLKGYIKAPRSIMLGGDLESFEIEFIEADLHVPSTPAEPLEDWSFDLSKTTLDIAGTVDLAVLAGFSNLGTHDQLTTMVFSPDGTKMLLRYFDDGGPFSSKTHMAEYDLTEPWNPNSAVYLSKFKTGGSNATMHFNSDGSKLFEATGTTLKLYTLNTAYSIADGLTLEQQTTRNDSLLRR